MGGDHGGHVGDYGGHGGGGDFRQKVWSMTGGPYCRPVHWRRNTAIAMFGVFLICIPIAIKSAELEEVCTAAMVDSPKARTSIMGGSRYSDGSRGRCGSIPTGILDGGDNNSFPENDGALIDGSPWNFGNALITQSGRSHPNCGAKTLAKKITEGML